jgi:hypothetical protein
MALRLLPKSEIASLKAKEQSRQIEEGVKVAKRVDALRETYAKTEQELEAYRIATLGAIGDEIRVLGDKKEKLSGELHDMQQKYDSLMPDISIKRNELRQFEKSLKGWEQKLEKREESAALAEIDVAEAKKKTEMLLISQEDNERISRNLLLDAENKKKEAQTTLDTAKKVRERAYIDHENMDAVLKLREFTIKTKEQDISKKELELMNKERGLDKEKIKVADMRETLDRALKRIKEGRLA